MAGLLGRWAIRASLGIVAVALVMSARGRLPQLPIGPYEEPDSTFCYDAGVTTRYGGEGDVESAACFSVSPSGLITKVFTYDEADEKLVQRASVIHGTGHAIPGLWDGHGHLLQYGEYLNSVDLFGCASFADVTSRLLAYIDTHDEIGTRSHWIRGVGWDQMALGAMPTADLLELDARLKGLYIMLDRIDVHCVWVSHAILALLPHDLPDVPGGEIIRDPPGMGVFCDNAMEAVHSVWPKPDRKRLTEYLQSSMKGLHAVGLVGMHDAGVTPTQLQLYQELATTDAWTMRVYAMAECSVRNTYCADDVPKFEAGNGMLSLRSVKLFADGALGSWGSAMIDPYSDRPSTTGSLLVNASTLTALTKAWGAAGYQVNIHAIGDLANRLAIDAMEASLLDLCPGQMASTCQAEHRFRIEHSQIITLLDQARMQSLGIVPSVQPTHATSDMKYAELRLGAQRTRDEAYRMQSFRPLMLVLGSDFPVEPPNPFSGIYAAVTRKSPQSGKGKDGSDHGWYAEEALSLRDAMTGFTEGAAHGAFLEDRAGRIKVGAFADWVVIDEPLEDMDLEDLRKLQVKETWVAGKRVFTRDEKSTRI